ncbi:protein-L-isoaspartate(D-aspartate) O-methyltransferase [Nocardiopsis sp. Huas11]|uniref:methyltransferase domain-containing protein n=1 Tax=Nocardiopsis sp. Huas11 TaxID=2183912 RepID=UPI000EAC1280|nr:methyltransferase domain-containing protein [Nocardiopsis sp. Huas11]RKS05554.1 protein-L-isoaspartate(D-aspartate) O-methyltransferase [Nocardiopsis sp. Huas11]
MTDQTPQTRAARLAEELRTKGEIRTQAWQEAFAAVPRETFIPYLATYTDGQGATEYRLHDGTDSSQRDTWLALVYSDTTLITQLNERPVEEVVTSERGEGHATSSSTAPGLMARLLETLDVRDGHRVLEIGTGTGFNAALLSRRLGAQYVTTIDIDADLTDKARQRLATVGLNPAVHTVDGRQGWLGNAPYDRIMATCSTPHVPYAWVEQTCDGGKILANVAGALGGAMVLAEVRDGTAEGRFLPQWAGFMWARPGFAKAGDIQAQDTEEGSYDTFLPTIGVDALHDRAFTFVLQLALPDVRPYWARDDQGGEITGLITLDGSWAEHVNPAGARPAFVEQGGPRRLWTVAEDAHVWWEANRRPDWSAFGLTVTPGGQHVWHGSPGSATKWALPTS